MTTSELRLPTGPVDLRGIDPASTPGFVGDKSAGRQALVDLAPELADLQERLFAQGRSLRSGGSGQARSVLLVLQGMDTSGKGGVLRRTVGLVDPQGVRITSFGPPSPAERDRDFLWRIRPAVPPSGYLGVFDRSHYEDVLVARVRSLAPPAEIERRYGAINDFEQELVEQGTVVVKCLLHISPDEQAERLAARLDDPTKHWKYDPGDLDDRAQWPAYREAYQVALEQTHTQHAPWYVVPADRRWFRDLAVARLLRDALAGLDLRWPAADFDVAAEQSRLAAAAPVR